MTFWRMTRKQLDNPVVARSVPAALRKCLSFVEWPKADQTREGAASIHEFRREIMHRKGSQMYTRLLGAQPKAMAAPPRTIKETSPEAAQIFVPSEDYRSLTFRGKEYVVTAKQAEIIKILHDAAKGGHPDVGKRRILEARVNAYSQRQAK